MSASSSKRTKYIIGGTIILVAVAAAVCILIHARRERTRESGFALPDIAAPEGWYAHRVNDANLMFTRDKVLPVREATEGYAYGEQIDVGISTTTLDESDWLRSQGLTDPQLVAAFHPSSSWGTLGGYPVFTMEFAGEADEQKSEFLFVGDTVYSFMLYPDDPKEYAALDRIVKEVVQGSGGLDGGNILR